MAQYTSKSRDEIFVLWKTVNEWAEYFYESVTKHHRLDSLETLEYIMGDDDNINEEYYGMDKDLLIIILQRCEANKKCMVMFIL